VAALHVFPTYKYFKYYTLQKRKEYLACSSIFLPFSHQTTHNCNHGLFDWNREENVMKELNVPAFFVLGKILTIYRLGKHAKQPPDL